MDKPFKLKLNKFADMTKHEFMSTGSSKVSHCPLSEQELVDCDNDNDNQGCDGRLMEQAFEPIKKSNGLTTKNNYPYRAKDEFCDSSKLDGSMVIIDGYGMVPEKDEKGLMKDEFCDSSKLNGLMVIIDGYEMVPEKDEKTLMKAVANQPVSILLPWVLMAKDFQFYLEGVFPGDCSTELNHGVAVVGYGATLDETKYWVWIVKNSWGETGERRATYD
ncbi:hypothetical protein V6N13_124463 [Hibiscus sabdariffa]|uniref:Uncharacterized protein n=2 Tax=Hibiscus sabdariffa TaxID=183260 RepID=A0ABR2S1F6_9ROSI